MLDNSGTPLGWHSKWKADGRLEANSAAVISHEQFCKVIQTLACYDQLNCANIAAAEMCMRYVMLTEERLKEKFSAASSDLGEEVHLFEGSRNRANLCISPALSAWIADQLKEETLVLKERRKAREERQLARPKKGAKD